MRKKKKSSWLKITKDIKFVAISFRIKIPLKNGKPDFEKTEIERTGMYWISVINKKKKKRKL